MQSERTLDYNQHSRLPWVLDEVASGPNRAERTGRLLFTDAWLPLTGQARSFL